MPGLVLEKRRFPRVSLPASGLLVYKDGMHYARLENISLTGALITLQEENCPDISRGERCSLALYPNCRGGMLRVNTRMVHYGFGMACLRFDNLDDNTRLMLRSIIGHQLPEPRRVSARSSACRG